MRLPLKSGFFYVPFVFLSVLLAGCETTTQSTNGLVNIVELDISFKGFENEFSCNPIEVDTVEDVIVPVKSTNPSFSMRVYYKRTDPGFILCASQKGDPKVLFPVSTQSELPVGVSRALIVISKDGSAQVTARLQNGTTKKFVREEAVNFSPGGWRM